MPNRLPYHQRRLIAKGLATEQDFKKADKPVVVEAVEEFEVEDSYEEE